MSKITVLTQKNDSQEFTKKEFELNVGDNLYQGIFDLGLDLPHGCLSGACGACRVEILEGSDQLSTPSTIEKQTLEDLFKEYEHSPKASPSLLQSFKEKKVRLSCRATIKSDGPITIKPFK